MRSEHKGKPVIISKEDHRLLMERFNPDNFGALDKCADGELIFINEVGCALCNKHILRPEIVGCNKCALKKFSVSCYPGCCPGCIHVMTDLLGEKDPYKRAFVVETNKLWFIESKKKKATEQLNKIMDFLNGFK